MALAKAQHFQAYENIKAQHAYIAATQSANTPVVLSPVPHHGSVVVPISAAKVAPVAYVPPAVHYHPVPVSSQYHSQDKLGQYSYGYAGALSSKTETKTADGVTRGGYSYIDANGVLQTVQYISDPVNGFRVKATNLPVAPAVTLVGPKVTTSVVGPKEQNAVVTSGVEVAPIAVQSVPVLDIAAVQTPDDQPILTGPPALVTAPHSIISDGNTPILTQPPALANPIPFQGPVVTHDNLNVLTVTPRPIDIHTHPHDHVQISLLPGPNIPPQLGEQGGLNLPQPVLNTPQGGPILDHHQHNLNVISTAHPAVLNDHRTINPAILDRHHQHLSGVTVNPILDHHNRANVAPPLNVNPATPILDNHQPFFNPENGLNVVNVNPLGHILDHHNGANVAHILNHHKGANVAETVLDYNQGDHDTVVVNAAQPSFNNQPILVADERGLDYNRGGGRNLNGANLPRPILSYNQHALNPDEHIVSTTNLRQSVLNSNQRERYTNVVNLAPVFDPNQADVLQGQLVLNHERGHNLNVLPLNPAPSQEDFNLQPQVLQEQPGRGQLLLSPEGGHNLNPLPLNPAHRSQEVNFNLQPQVLQEQARQPILPVDSSFQINGNPQVFIPRNEAVPGNLLINDAPPNYQIPINPGGSLASEAISKGQINAGVINQGVYQEEGGFLRDGGGSYEGSIRGGGGGPVLFTPSPRDDVQQVTQAPVRVIQGQEQGLFGGEGGRVGLNDYGDSPGPDIQGPSGYYTTNIKY